MVITIPIVVGGRQELGSSPGMPAAGYASMFCNPGVAVGGGPAIWGICVDRNMWQKVLMPAKDTEKAKRGKSDQDHFGLGLGKGRGGGR